MLRIAMAVALGLGVVTLSTVVTAQDKKEEKKTTLEGTLTCTKCALKETAKCGHALIVKKDEKEIKYYIADKGGREPYHREVCTEDKPAKVTGIVGKKGKKMTITKAEVEVKK